MCCSVQTCCDFSAEAKVIGIGFSSRHVATFLSKFLYSFSDAKLNYRSTWGISFKIYIFPCSKAVAQKRVSRVGRYETRCLEKYTETIWGQGSEIWSHHVHSQIPCVRARNSIFFHLVLFVYDWFRNLAMMPRTKSLNFCSEIRTCFEKETVVAMNIWVFSIYLNLVKKVGFLKFWNSNLVDRK